MIPRSSTEAAIAQGARRRGRLSGRARAVSALSEIAVNCNAMSRVDCHRFSGSLARQVLTSQSRAAGLIACEAETGGGSVARIADINDAWLAPENAFFPVTIS
jgi:hypothetical protein